MKEVALLTLHGMGEVDAGYYDEFEAAIKRELAADWERVAFHSVTYAEVLQGPQRALWDAMRAESTNDLDATRLRRFLLYFLSDAATLEHSANRAEDDRYLLVQQQIQAGLSQALVALGGDESKPVVIIAHSLGAQVISNYLWDAQMGNHSFDGWEDDSKPFLRLRSLKQFTTIGCNIPIFVGGLADRECFKPIDGMRWDNYYDPDDVLGWPLRQLGQSYEFVHDHPVNAGGSLTNWNLWSHGGYWDDRDVICPLARRIRELI
ncbi:MAG TPA: hypothetical protein DCR55_00090 [Lentisphaeria bacterium]|jgi:hypothetical protein|nr:hypothetical protein [Lentisphaeria bacterium]